MIHSKTMIWTVAAMAVVVFAAAPTAEAFVYPMVAIPILAVALGTGAYVADEVMDENVDKEPAKAEKKIPSADTSEFAAESMGRGGRLATKERRSGAQNHPSLKFGATR
jgi:hypothetical protein